MSDGKWDNDSDEMEDEDLIMDEDEQEHDNDDERHVYSHSEEKLVYPEEIAQLTGRNIASRFDDHLSHHTDFSHFGSSPVSSWGESIDEKEETAALMMHLEKSIIHQKFFNSFDDDFNEDDLA